MLASTSKSGPELLDRRDEAAIFPAGSFLPFFLVTALFFLWGIPNNLNDVLIRQFMKSFAISRFQAGLVRSAFYMGYFLLAMPAALLMRSRGLEKAMSNLFFVSILISAVSIPVSGQNPRHPFTFDDAATLHSAAPVAVSPDGKSILYRVTYGGIKGPDSTEWRLIAPAGGESHHLDIPEKFQPTGFTRDGSVLYGLYEVNKIALLATIVAGSVEYSCRCCCHACPTRDPTEGDSFRFDLSGWLALRNPGRPSASRSAERCAHDRRSSASQSLCDRRRRFKRDVVVSGYTRCD
jgi:hypothetical protein